MARAVTRLAELGGGEVVVEDARRPRGAAAADRRAALRRAARGRARAEPRRASRRRARLGCELPAPFQTMSFLALSVIPSLKITDRGLVDVDRFELVALQRVILANAYVVTWTTPAPSSTAAGSRRRTGSSRRWAAASRRAGERVDLGGAARHARPDQHAPPPLPDAHAHPRAAGRPVHVAADALPAVGADRRGVGVRGGAHRARGARARRLHDRLRPPLRLPARRQRARRGRGRRRRASSACRIVASRGSMDLGESDGGLPPDELVEDLDACSPTRSASPVLHEEGPGAGCRSSSRRARRSP